jgi:hypothetical protein
MSNPQIFRGKPLKGKAEEKITLIICEVAAIKWGCLNFDLIFTNIVSQCMRGMRFRMSKRGNTLAVDRDFSKSIKYKASTIKNRTLKTKMRIRSADYNENVRKLHEKVPPLQPLQPLLLLLPCALIA